MEQRLEKLEREAIALIREVITTHDLRRLRALYTGDLRSCALLHLLAKAFHPRTPNILIVNAEETDGSKETMSTASTGSAGNTATEHADRTEGISSPTAEDIASTGIEATAGTWNKTSSANKTETGSNIQAEIKAAEALQSGVWDITIAADGAENRPGSASSAETEDITNSMPSAENGHIISPTNSASTDITTSTTQPAAPDTGSSAETNNAYPCPAYTEQETKAYPTGAGRGDNEKMANAGDAAQGIDSADGRPENTSSETHRTLRVFPLSSWTGRDVQEYARAERIDAVPRYLSHYRTVVEEEGLLLSAQSSEGGPEPTRFEGAEERAPANATTSQAET